MSESGFSEELDRFLAQEIHSVEQLEILLLLSGNTDRWWTAGSVYDVVKSNLNSVEERLKQMAERGFLQKAQDPEPGFKFEPKDARVRDLVSQLRTAYKERSVKVVQAIYSKPPDAVQEFARAFRIRKDQ
jgi:hypothetical protein